MPDDEILGEPPALVGRGSGSIEQGADSQRDHERRRYGDDGPQQKDSGRTPERLNLDAGEYL